MRWSVKPKDPIAMTASAVASPPSSSSLGRRGRNDEHGKESAGVPTRAIDVYRNICTPAAPDSDVKVTMAAGDCSGDLVIHAVLEQMVLAVVSISDPGRAKMEARGSWKSNGQMAVASKRNDSHGTNKPEEIVTSQKRKRGRPKKEPNGTDPAQILRSVSNSDSDNGPEDHRKRGRPRKSPATNEDVKEGAKEQLANGLLS